MSVFSGKAKISPVLHKPLIFRYITEEKSDYVIAVLNKSFYQQGGIAVCRRRSQTHTIAKHKQIEDYF